MLVETVGATAATKGALGAVVVGGGEALVKLLFGESLKIALAVGGRGTGDLFINWLTAAVLLLRDDVEAVLKAGLAAGVSNTEAIGFIMAGVLFTLLRGSTGLSEHWFKIGVSR